jgi:hypothetical protein
MAGREGVRMTVRRRHSAIDVGKSPSVIPRWLADQMAITSVVAGLFDSPFAWIDLASTLRHNNRVCSG